MVDSVFAISTSIPWWIHVINAFGTSFPWIVIALLIVLVIISVFGNIGIDWTSKKFTFGHKEENKKQPEIINKRSCVDCIMLLLGKRTIFESTYQTLQSKILRDQMTYTEHKIQEIKYLLLQTYQNDINYFREGDPDLIRENKEYTIYQESLSNAMHLAKDEVRRSFKENGFHSLGSSEFKVYINEKYQTLITMVREYLRRTYPSSGMIVKLQDRFKRTDNKDILQIENIISDIYWNAKNTRNKIESEMKILQENFVKDIDLVVGGKDGQV